jgi:hypothetical protein
MAEDNKGRPEEIIKEHSDENWSKLLREVRVECESYEDVYGVRIVDVFRWRDEFLKLEYQIMDQEKFYEFKEGNEGYTIASFLNYELRKECCPSFYENNLEDYKTLFEFKALTHNEE